jgi:hypothetical protein
MLRVLVALVLLAHGIGHVLGPLQVLRISTVNPEWHGDSWLLSGLGTTATQLAGLFIWFVALAGFVAVAAVVMGWLPADWWAPLAIGSSVVSLIGIGLFPTAFPTFSTIGAVAIDVVVVIAVTWLSWTPAALSD